MLENSPFKVEQSALDLSDLDLVRMEADDPVIDAASRKAALAKPLPGAAGDAFLTGAIKLDEHTIFEVMPIHIKALQAVESPLLDLITGLKADGNKAASSKQIDDPLEQQMICLIFTENPETLLDVPKSELAGYIKTQSAKFRPLRLEDVEAISTAVLAQFKKFVEATVRRRAQLEEQVPKSFFQAFQNNPSEPKA